MKYIIELSEEDYTMYSNDTWWLPPGLLDALRKAKTLPEGHGRLIDADAFLEENKDYTGWILCSDAWGGENAYKDTLEDLINEAPTIIGAEKGA